MPLVLWTTLRRLGKEMNSGSEEGKMALALSGMMWLRCSVVNSYDIQLLSSTVSTERGVKGTDEGEQGSKGSVNLVVVGLVKITRHASNLDEYESLEWKEL